MHQGTQPGAGAGLAAAFGQRPGRADLEVVGVARQGALHQLLRGHAVDQGVVHLGVDGEPAVLEAFDDVCLPQRAMPVQQAAVPPRGQLEQFAHPARRRQRRAPDVVVDVDVRVVGPAQVGDPADELRRVFAERGLEIRLCHQLFVEVPDEVSTGALRRLVQLQPADVHRMFARLSQQEDRVGGHDQFHPPIRRHAGGEVAVYNRSVMVFRPAS